MSCRRIDPRIWNPSMTDSTVSGERLVEMMAAMRSSDSVELKQTIRGVDIRAHEQSVLAGAIGAALWGAFRFRKLSDKGLSLSA